MSEWTDTRLPADYCPLCGYKLDAASSPTKATPDPGDCSVCLSCASALVFGDNLRLRVMTTSEIADMHPDDRKKLREFQRAVRMLDRRKLKGNYLR